MAGLDFDGLARQLLASAETHLASWLPAGRKRGNSWVAGDLSGAAGQSLKVNLATGAWSDFATGDHGSDLVSLYAAIYELPMGDAYRHLGGETKPAKRVNGHAHAAPPPEPVRRVVTPVPADFAECPCVHTRYGKPSARWTYRNAGGEVLGYIARYEPAGERKQIIPWTWDGERWGMGQWPSPRPLYGLQELAERPGAAVLVVEGEKAADAARRSSGPYVVVTWPAGAMAADKADWTPLAGRKVLLWPDADEPGRKAMERVAQIIHERATEVKVLDVSGQPHGWDAADADFACWDDCKAFMVLRARKWRPSAAVAIPPSIDPETGEIDARPQLDLVLMPNGTPIMNLDNVVRAIESDPNLRGKIWYDEFLDTIMTTWQGEARQWKDADDVLLQLYMQRHVGLTRIGLQTCHDAAVVAAFHDTRNECKDWLKSLAWDGVRRLSYLMSEGLGAPENAYTDAVGRCWVMSMVARVFRPGCKVDTVPVLEGTQGAGKSTALRILGGKWFTECHENVTHKDFYEVLKGHMLVEIAEMHSFTRAEVERIKGIISCQMDRYRKSYGRNTENHPRQTVLACTTNRDDWQRDETGARRFWPVRCGNVNHDWLRDNRDQLFAEAVHLFNDGGSWWDVPMDLQNEEVESRRDSDSWESVIGGWLWNQNRPTTSEILSDCLKIEIGRHDQIAQKRVGRVMRVLGWRTVITKSTNGRSFRAWVKDE
jgi:putative DNA primase/helicase